MNNKNQVIRVVGMGFVIIIFAASSTFALAAGPKNYRNAIKKTATKGPVIVGTVSSINGNSISLTAKNGTTYMIDAVSANIIKAPDTQIHTNDIQAGDMLVVHGAINGSNVTASSILDEVKKSNGIKQIHLKKSEYIGVISAINGSNFTIKIKSRKNSTNILTVNTSTSTVFTKNGQADSLTDLAVGQMVSLQGALDSSTNTISATNVNIVIRMFPLRFTGTVQAISGANLSVRASYGTTYNVDTSKAKISYSNGVKANFSIIQNNDQVIVQGRHISGSTNIIAASVRDSSRKAN